MNLPLRSRLAAFVFFSVLASAGCATVAPYEGPPLAQMPQAIMTAKPCSPMAFTPTPNVNATTGWTAKLAAGQPPLTCNLKYSSGPFYCANPSQCPGDLVWGTHPNDPKDRDKEWHGLVDLLNGSILACAQPSNRFGVRGQIDCETKTYSATPSAPIRIVLPVKVPALQPGGSQQTATSVEVLVRAAPGSGPIAIGQIGFAEQASNP